MSTAPPPRYLTKSRFKLALECPTKLFYTGKAEFHNRAQEDAFLHALAEGGFQVGALARLMYPGGVEVIDDSHAGQLATTRELLQRPEVTVYEAALEAQGLFVRVDILRKRGDEIELIEVKAKSYHPKEGPDFRCARGQLSSDMLPYLQDIAFQRYVAALAFPAFRYRCFLMLADKSAKSSVDGINQRFRIKRAGPRTSVEVAPGTDSAQLGAPLLRAVPVDEHVDEIVGGELVVLDRSVSFGEGVALWAAAYRADDRISPRPSSMCASCEFKTPTFPEPGQPRSGFHECWAESFGWQATDFAGGTVLDLWNYRNKPKLLAASVLKLSDVTPTHLSLADCAPGPAGMSRAQRQWFQCSGQWPGGGEQFVNTAGLRAVMCAWRYPLHFIDFETSAVAIPFRRGQHPYETIAFQFSHHVMHADGRVEHKSQFLEARPGVDPTLPFLRALRAALSDDEGTVFRWAAHEKTVLQQLRRRLLADVDPPEDVAELVAFIDSIASTSNDRELHGRRTMVDLCELASLHYFHPSTQGSASLKAVLPALMQGSAWLRSIYSRPVYGMSAEILSLNFREPVAWWVRDQGRILDPYELLPPVFPDLRPADGHSCERAGMSELRDGGAALSAYARLQFEDLSPATREAIEHALLRYCELDTLAMVMAVQAWQAWVAEAPY